MNAQLQMEPASGCNGNLITTCSPYPEVKMLVESTNTFNNGGKVSFVSRGSSVSDYSIISAVEQNNDKVFAGFTKESGSYTESFIVYGNGKIFSTEIHVQLPPFPDYVFYKDYPLLPIKELKSYIIKNKRLPKMPSSKEVAENNIGLGLLATKQMEKIEELTLYIIELNERIEVLEKESSKLKKKRRKKKKH